MEEYFCPNCDAILNEQDGFDPTNGSWECTECGHFLMDDDVYDGDKFEGVAWFCDGCGELLNKQSGFLDYYDSWTCTECYCRNDITGDAIIDNDLNESSYSYYDKAEEEDEDYDYEDNEEEYFCPNCDAILNEQYGFDPTNGSWKCTECNQFLMDDDVYDSDGFEGVAWFCDECGELLNRQSGFSDYYDSWTCTECYCRNDITTRNIVKERKTDDSIEFPFFDLAEMAGSLIGTLIDVVNNRPKKIKRLTNNELRKKRLRAFFFKRKKIKMDYNYFDLIGEDIEDVEILLFNMAFKNIKMMPIKDIDKDSSNYVGEVEKVIIGETSNFLKGDLINYKTPIIITYHEKREITIPFSEKELKKLKYTEVEERFKELGFVNVHSYPLQNLVTGLLRNPDRVKQINIGNTSTFKKYSSFNYDENISIEYHSFR